MPEKTKTTEEKTEVSEYKLLQIPTEYRLAIQTPTGEAMSIEQALVEVLNKQDKVINLLA